MPTIYTNSRAVRLDPAGCALSAAANALRWAGLADHARNLEHPDPLPRPDFMAAGRAATVARETRAERAPGSHGHGLALLAASEAVGHAERARGYAAPGTLRDAGAAQHEAACAIEAETRAHRCAAAAAHDRVAVVAAGLADHLAGRLGAQAEADYLPHMRNSATVAAVVDDVAGCAGLLADHRQNRGGTAAAATAAHLLADAVRVAGAVPDHATAYAAAASYALGQAVAEFAEAQAHARA